MVYLYQLDISNGFLIQWNHTRISDCAITLPISYQTTNYVVIVPAIHFSDHAALTIGIYSVSSFGIGSAGIHAISEMGWATIGY